VTRPLLLTCEHGGNDVPAEYAQLFRGAQALLDSHRGLDIGALAIARHLEQRLHVPLVAATTTRLLVDLNRSPSHPRLLSEFTRGLNAPERQRLLARHYQPYRDRVTHWLVQRASSAAPVVHVSVHTFAAVLNGRARRCDVGLLYDPSRTGESDFCRAWQAMLAARGDGLVVRRNYPYRGVSDGLVTWLRRRLDGTVYVGIELEVNQALALRGGPRWRKLLGLLAGSLAAMS
jgi:predicted N-formylglutamate amidohydrolase